jgi:hypothetical protein
MSTLSSTVRPVKPSRPLTLTPNAVHALVAVEYSMVAAGGQLVDLADELDRAADALPVCGTAARQVRRLRALLGKVLECLDGPITEAAQLHEAEMADASADACDYLDDVPF